MQTTAQFQEIVESALRHQKTASCTRKHTEGLSTENTQPNKATTLQNSLLRTWNEQEKGKEQRHDENESALSPSTKRPHGPEDQNRQFFRTHAAKIFHEFDPIFAHSIQKVND